MLKFKNQNQLCLEQEKLKFRHTHFSDLSEFESFAKGFSGNGFHLGDQSFECYISQVLEVTFINSASKQYMKLSPHKAPKLQSSCHK